MSWTADITSRLRKLWNAVDAARKAGRLWLKSRDGRPRVSVGDQVFFEVTGRVVDEVRSVLIGTLGLEDLSQTMRALTEEQRGELVADVFRRFYSEDFAQGGAAITELYRSLVDCSQRNARNATPAEVGAAVDFFCEGYHERVVSGASLALSVGTPPSAEPYSSPVRPTPAMPLPST